MGSLWVLHFLPASRSLPRTEYVVPGFDLVDFNTRKEERVAIQLGS